MAAPPLPQALPPFTSTLALTPGTYSELVADTLGDTPIEQDPILAKADDAALLLSNAGDALPGASDAAAALAATRGAIPAAPGAQIGAQLAGASAAVGSKITDYHTLTPPDANPILPSQPVNPTTPVSSSASGTIIGAANPATAPPAIDTPGPGYAIAGGWIVGQGYAPFVLTAQQIMNAAPGASITAAALIDVDHKLTSVALIDAAGTYDATQQLFLAVTLDTSTTGNFAAQIAVQLDGGADWTMIWLYFSISM